MGQKKSCKKLFSMQLTFLIRSVKRNSTTKNDKRNIIVILFRIRLNRTFKEILITLRKRLRTEHLNALVTTFV